MMTDRRKVSWMAAVIAMLMPSVAAWGLINLIFTPVQLVDQSQAILITRVKTREIANRVELELVSAIKGRAPAILFFDMSSTPEQHAKATREQLRSLGGKPMLLFIADQKIERSYLHVNGTWLKLAGKDGKWRLEAVDESMQGTWNGGTDMLTRCVQYILADRTNATVPVEAGTSWRAIKKIGDVAGQARDISAVDLACDGRLSLFVASENGDRLLKGGKEGFEDITEKVKLASKSRLAAWGDFNGDSRMDLASCDGKALTFWTQAADGSFSAGKPGGTSALPADCVGMATIGVSGMKRPGLLISPASGPPLLLKPSGKNAFVPAPLLMPAPAPKEFGKALACLVADFNGDSLIDIIQPFEKGGLIYLGNEDGGFDPPRPCAVCCTIEGGKAALGDLDGDGLLDVLVAGAEGVNIFQNLGNGLFQESLGLSGEVAYKSQPFASWCGVGDFNSDSRRDLFITYSAQPMLLYFNRGFRSFGQAPKLEMALDEIPDFAKGQQMGLLADLSGSGAQDLILVMNNGEIWCASNDLGGEDARSIQARLSSELPAPGPVNVSLWRDQRCLGTTTVQVGSPPAHFGIQASGAYTLKWRFPHGQEISKVLSIGSKPVTVVLDQAR